MSTQIFWAPVSPTCCDASRAEGVVELFCSKQDGKARWVARRFDAHKGPRPEGEIVDVRACPFCGAKLGAKHVPFSGPREPEKTLGTIIGGHARAAAANKNKGDRDGKASTAASSKR